jgi:hypothetical protein
METTKMIANLLIKYLFLAVAFAIVGNSMNYFTAVSFGFTSPNITTYAFMLIALLALFVKKETMFSVLIGAMTVSTVFFTLNTDDNIASRKHIESLAAKALAVYDLPTDDKTVTDYIIFVADEQAKKTLGIYNRYSTSESIKENIAEGQKTRSIILSKFNTIKTAADKAKQAEFIKYHGAFFEAESQGTRPLAHVLWSNSASEVYLFMWMLFITCIVILLSTRKV